MCSFLIYEFLILHLDGHLIKRRVTNTALTLRRSYVNPGTTSASNIVHKVYVVDTGTILLPQERTAGHKLIVITDITILIEYVQPDSSYGPCYWQINVYRLSKTILMFFKHLKSASFMFSRQFHTLQTLYAKYIDNHSMFTVLMSDR